MRSTVLVLLLLGSTSLGDEPAKPGEQVGTVLGKPILRGDLDGKSPVTVFIAPVAEKYRKDHAEEITPTEAEITAATKYYDGQHAERMKKQGPELRRRLAEIERLLEDDELGEEKRRELEIEKLGIGARSKPPGRGFAQFALTNWKFQRHLHGKYGGGRLLFQQAGLEAFDASRRWLEDLEKQGEFTVTDPAVRKQVFHYWTRDHGAFLTDDEEQIKDFLEPNWLDEVVKAADDKR